MSFKSKLQFAATASRDLRWWPFFLQRAFMHPQRRDALAARLARLRRSGMPEGAANKVQAMERVKQLRSRGNATLGQALSTQQCQALREYFTSRDVHDPYRPALAPFRPLGEGRHENTHVAHHSAADVMNAPGLLALANRPDILATVAEFLGCMPTLSYAAAWWSYTTPLGAQQAEFFHRDVDDWRFIKLFVYLTDVGEESGPHVYVAGSSISPRLARIRRFTDDEVTTEFGRDSVLTMKGMAGDAFLEDTFGIHKGQPVARGNRLIFQAVYSMHALPYGPRKPVVKLTDAARANPGVLLDPWINRHYLQA
jgi:hypothetical protein